MKYFRVIVLLLLLDLQIKSAYATLHICLNHLDKKLISLVIQRASAQKDLLNIEQVITQDLQSSGIFNVAKTSKSNYRLYLKSNSINAQQISIEYSLTDFSNKLIYKNFIKGKTENLRYLSHKISDKIYNIVTKRPGYFTSKIIFIDETGPLSNPIKRIAIMDQDGDNVEYLTTGQELVVTPKISSDREYIIYTAYVDERPTTYLQKILSGERMLIAPTKNGSIAPNFVPNSNDIVFSALRMDGSSNLFKVAWKNNSTLDNNLAQTMQRLTYGNFIDTSCSFSPDGKKIVFSSNRSGRPKLYIMDLDGSHIQLISQGEGSYSTPSWCPQGDYIAFTKKDHGVFSIGVMKSDGSEEHILASSFHSEKPSWCPNGTMLVYYKEVENSHHKLFLVDLLTGAERMLPTPNDATDPEWF